ncbi:DUF4956 domain-containing protein [Ornithinibacillus halophilus]|uniref:DUF4956 domain-containing protein n=1 Tax=Ornithinibacillus halophilus TaxID=930117 RepID=A0A1M5L1I9_9BACI|nr:DUF4956 domain-containing protein [Ornithinibacillus halophilus]SHG58887.1 protein of unknown function [Ornithinibacillus halophilus]
MDFTTTIIGMMVAAILSIFITTVYQITFKGERYSQSFVHTIIIMSIIVSAVMNIISDNAGVAFGLFAIFSLIRFRSAVTDAKDISFMFFGLIIGMAAGLNQIMVAILLTLFASLVIYLLDKYNYAKGKDSQILKITVPENLNHEDLFEDILLRYTDSHTLRSVETTNLGTMILYTFAIRSKTTTKDQELLNVIRERNANLKVSLSYLENN